MEQQQKVSNQKDTEIENCLDTNTSNEDPHTDTSNTREQAYKTKKEMNVMAEENEPRNEKVEGKETHRILRRDDNKLEEYSPDRRFARLATVIGHGSQKLVYKAIDNYDAKEVAWNVLDTKDCPEAFLGEINLLKSIQHPNIIKMKDFWFTNSHVYFITELMTSGTLREYIKNINPTLRIIRNWSTQILLAIEHLHEKNMIHRDIKCENIFVNGSTGELKVGDLGISKQGQQRRYTIIGTPEFMAREVFEGDGYGKGVDIYAFGMALLEISTRDYPYHECSNAHEVFKRIMSGVPPESLFKVKNACLRNLIIKCIAPENERFTVRQCLSHHFIANDIIEDEPESAPEESNQPTNGCKECLLFHQDYAFPNTKPLTDTSLTLISSTENILYLQLYYKDMDRFIKFDFDIYKDTVDSIVEEMIGENVFSRDKLEWLKEMMVTGIASIKAGIIKNNNVTPLIKAWANNESVKQEPTLQTQPVEAKENTIITESTDTTKVEQPTTPILTELDFPDKIYPDEMLIDEFVKETATVTKRDEVTAQSWIKTIKSQEMRTVGDLKILVDEDWGVMGLTVFSSRAMKNMLYGKDKHPPKEKDLTSNSYATFGDDTTTEDFISSLSTLIDRNGTNEWKDKLLRQDVRSVGELKSLTVSDWEKLELSVFGSRVIKNVVFSRGKITKSGKII